MRFKDTDPTFRSCYSNTTLLKMNDWSVGHKNNSMVDGMFITVFENGQ